MLKTYHQTKIALGSDVSLVIVADYRDELHINNMFNKLWLRIFKFERQFSRFVANSELSQFNLNAGIKQPISAEFAEIIETSKKLSVRSNKLFNPFILPALQRAGYVKSFVPGYQNDYQLNFSDRRVADIDELKTGNGWATIPFNTALDFGGIGKGFLADKLTAITIDQPIIGYWFSLGGDLVGSGYDESGRPWQVEIDDGSETGQTKLFLQTNGKQFAVATSGTQLRRGMYKGLAWHHILNPTTLLPAETDLYLTSIYGSSATEADVFASVAVILGSDNAAGFLRDQSSIKAGVMLGLKQSGGQFQRSFGQAVKIRKTEANYVK